MAFVRVRIPETGAHVDVHEDALKVHPGLQRLDRPETEHPRPAKQKKSIQAAAAAATAEKE